MTFSNSFQKVSSEMGEKVRQCCKGKWLYIVFLVRWKNLEHVYELKEM